MSGLPKESGHYGGTSVSQAEVNAFRTSISARRFPALREMRDEDIAALVIANKKVHNKRLLGTKPALAEVVRTGHDPMQDYHVASSAAYPKGPHEHHNLETHGGSRPAFSPCNPSMAKDDILRKGEDPYLGSTIPYEKHMTREQLRREDIDAKPFVPNSASQAKTSISINYYLNSPDDVTLQTEKEYIQNRAMKNSLKLTKTGYGRAVNKDTLRDKGTLRDEDIETSKLNPAGGF